MLFVFSLLYFVTPTIAIKEEDKHFNLAVKTVNTVWPVYTTWYPVLDNNPTFEVHVGHDAWICLTPTAHQTAPKYEVLLGADDNTKVKILKNRNLILAVNDIKVLDKDVFKGFWIKMENRYAPNLKISVGRKGNSTAFIEVEDEEHADINYMSIATTGADQNGWWHLNGFHQSYTLYERLNVISAMTITDPEASFEKFYEMTDNHLRLYVKVPCCAHVILLPKNETHNVENYEIVFGTQGNAALEIRKNGHTFKTFFNYSILDKTKYTGFWISATRNDDNGMIIAVGLIDKIKPLVTYYDYMDPIYDIRYFSIKTTSNPAAGVGYWRLVL